jgi:acetyl-CoA C-acetyltransferase
MKEIVIAGAARTPIGGFMGALSALPAHELGRTALTAALRRGGVSPEEVEELVMGQILTGGAGMNPARQTALAAKLSESSTAYVVNQVCGSGLRAVANAWQGIASGQVRIAAAGGQESMSLSPHAVQLRAGTKMGPAEMADTMIKDGLWDAFNGYHMGVTAENVAAKWQLTRDEQDEFAAASQAKAGAAIEAGRFHDEIVPVTVPSRKEEISVSADEHPRPGTTKDSLAKLRPAFKPDGTVTAGNASGLNDGAAAVVLMDVREADKRGVAHLGKIVSWATAGVDPKLMGTGPVPASKKALELAGWSVKDLDLIESNEAFAAQALAVNREMGWDLEKVNVNGGAIALGHPIGASGCRVLVTLLYEMRRREAKRGLATLCIGGGMGIAMCVERM